MVRLILRGTLSSTALFWFFFFQAEDGIRDHCVTGVQTCALPIWFPDALLLNSALTNRLGAILSPPGAPLGSFDFTTDVRPWLGKEAAFALLNTASTTAGSLILLDVRNRARAQAFLDRSGATPVRSYRGVTELRYRPGTVLSFVRHYLAIGQ